MVPPTLSEEIISPPPPPSAALSSAPAAGSSRANGRSRRPHLSDGISPHWITASQFERGTTENIQLSHKALQQAIDTRRKHEVELVIWHENGCTPMRRIQEARSFPSFTLAQFNDIIKRFKLDNSSWIDRYNPEQGVWQTVDIETTFTHDRTTTFLMKLRPNNEELLDCPRLSDELQEQPSPRRKRKSGPDIVSPPRRKYARPNPTSILSTRKKGGPSSPSSSRSSSSRSLGLRSQSRSPDPFSARSSSSPAPRRSSPPLHPASLPPSPTHRLSGTQASRVYLRPRTSSQLPRPLPAEVIEISSDEEVVVAPSKSTKKRRFPGDYYVYELHRGFESVMASSQARSIVFEHHFPDAANKWASSTWSDNYVKYWLNAPEELKARFIGYKHQESGLWGAFVKDFKKWKKTGSLSSATRCSRQNSSPIEIKPELEPLTEGSCGFAIPPNQIVSMATRDPTQKIATALPHPEQLELQHQTTSPFGSQSSMLTDRDAEGETDVEDTPGTPGHNYGPADWSGQELRLLTGGSRVFATLPDQTASTAMWDPSQIVWPQ
ncbi:hypothetical protein PUNSTDRAFT_138871 [Punctularia strigosozonata HHB-11173 SS5]|uniref:Uncharacterized protein n=1 Tax=Punctularia strigosozonata (strain HHB-11173) TaxID=741275 RepID=R7S2R9_PUNST|nr:uncharacterized protein PUNSTDRAFT_138871 [Punctularia strigosozonata HHB-11173 SS5]EIN04144.1 hypothetical protein PUNSTDRAFT_138871 [Punctularia strigosozonata HHB-11173 SS5]